MVVGSSSGGLVTTAVARRDGDGGGTVVVAAVMVNYGVICEDEAKRHNSGTKTKTFEENSYLLPYAISNEEDTVYQRQLITGIRVRSIPYRAYHSSPIRRISSWSSVKDLQLM
ncbi:hypothetical protein Tco_1011580 [Tanacetum coccineum]